MDVPPAIAFRDVAPTDRLKERILDRIDGLEDVYDHLVSCRVMVEDTTPGRSTGSVFRVRLDLGVPHHEIVVDHKANHGGQPRSAEQVLDEAFDRAQRRLKEVKARQRGDVKTHRAATGP